MCACVFFFFFFFCACVCVCVRARERKRHTHTHTHTHTHAHTEHVKLRERERERQTDRQTDRDREKKRKEEDTLNTIKTCTYRSHFILIGSTYLSCKYRARVCRALHRPELGSNRPTKITNCTRNEAFCYLFTILNSHK